MPVFASPRHAITTPGPVLQDPEAALANALWQTCRAEAEAMWNDIHRRLRADESRKAAFVEQMARNLVNKTTRRRRRQILRRLTANPSPAVQETA